MSNFDLLQQQILETLTQLKSFGAEIDMDEFNLLSASKSDEDDEDEDADADDILLLTDSVNAIRGKQEKQVRIQNRRKTKKEDIEPAPVLVDDDDPEPDQEPVQKESLRDKLARLRNAKVGNKNPVRKSDVAAPKIKVDILPVVEDDEDTVLDISYDDDDDDWKPKEEEEDVDDYVDPEEPEEELDTSNDVEDTRKIDDGDDTDTDTHIQEVAMPMTVHTKLDTNVKVLAVVDVEEYYALLLQLRLKIDALEAFAGDNDPLVLKLLKKTYNAYEAAEDKLAEIAEESFPIKLNKFGNVAQTTLLEELTSIVDAKKTYRFDTKNASYSRFVLIEDASVVYSFRIGLKNVADDDGYVFPEYYIVVSQKVFLTQEDQERGVPPRPHYFITRLLQDNPKYQLGIEFNNMAEMQVRIKKILAYDSLRTDLEKINIPFSEKELSQKFISEHVKKVLVDDEEHKIVVLLKSGTTVDQINLIIPDFMRNLGGIVNLKKLAIKYLPDITVPSISFVIIHKTKDKSVINREVLADMRERYSLTNEAFRGLVKALTIGN